MSFRISNATDPQHWGWPSYTPPSAWDPTRHPTSPATRFSQTQNPRLEGRPPPPPLAPPTERPAVPPPRGGGARERRGEGARAGVTLLAWAGGARKQRSAATAHRSFMLVSLGPGDRTPAKGTRGRKGTVAAARARNGVGGYDRGVQGFRAPPPRAAIPRPSLRGRAQESGGALGPQRPARARRPPPSAIEGPMSSGAQSPGPVTHGQAGARHIGDLGFARTLRGPHDPTPLPHARPLTCEPQPAARDPAGPASPDSHWLPEQPLRPAVPSLRQQGPPPPGRRGSRARDKEAFRTPEPAGKGSVGLADGNREGPGRRAPQELHGSASCPSPSPGARGRPVVW